MGEASRTLTTSFVVLVVAGLAAAVLGLYQILTDEMLWSQRAEPTTDFVRFYQVGGDDSAYGELSDKLIEELHNSFAVERTKSPGSLDTLLKIEKDSSGVGLVQADVLYHYLHGNHPMLKTRRPRSAVRSVLRLHEEWLYRGEYSTRVSKPDEKTVVYAGEVGSGTRLTYESLRSALAVDSWVTGPRTVASVFFRVFAANSPFSRVSNDDKNVSEEPLSESEVRVLVGAFGDARDVRSIKESRRVYVATDAILVANKSVPGSVVRQLIDAVKSWHKYRCESAEDGMATWERVDRWAFCAPTFRGSGDFSPASEWPAADDLPFSARGEGMAIARHDAAVLGQLGPVSKLLTRLSIVRIQGVLFLILAVVIFAYVIIRRSLGYALFKSYLARFVRRWGITVIVFVLVHAAAAIVIWLSEFHSDRLVVDNRFIRGGVLAGFSEIFRFLTTGSFSVDFSSQWSLVAVAVIKVGWGVATLLFGFHALQTLVHLGRNAMGEHVLIVGWNEQARTLVKELDSAKVSWSLATYREVEWPPGTGAHQVRRVGSDRTPSLDDALRQLNLGATRAVIVVSDVDRAKEKKLHVDLWVCRIAARIRLFEEKERKQGKLKRPCRVVLEIEDEASVKVATRAGRAAEGDSVTIVCVADFSARLLAHDAVTPGLVGVFNELLKTDADSNEIYYVSLEKLVRDGSTLTFGELRRRMSKKQVVVVGVREQDGGIKPNVEPAYRLQDGDELVCIAKEQLGKLTPEDVPPEVTFDDDVGELSEALNELRSHDDDDDLERRLRRLSEAVTALSEKVQSAKERREDP